MNGYNKYIERVREAASDAESAYLVRSRLKRLILLCSRLVAEICGITPPSLPGPFRAPEGSSLALQDIAHHCTKLVELSGIMCQPSEPMDSRWQHSYGCLKTHLDEIERLLSEAKL